MNNKESRFLDFDRDISTKVKNGVKRNELLKNHIFFRIGGEADYFIEPESIDDLKEVICLCNDCGIDRYVIGNGTNLLASDAGFRGAIIKVGSNFSHIEFTENRIVVGAGALLSSVSKRSAELGLKGLDFACGIPGYIGGAVAMNAGAYNGEIADTIRKVKCMSENGEIVELTKDEMNFGYRTSKIFDDNLIVLEAEFELERGNTEEILDRIAFINAKRKASQPLDYPSAGSTFKRPVGGYASKLIQDAGLKGYKYGGAMVSDKHSGFVVNYNHATCEEVMELMNHVAENVNKQFGIKLEPEVRIIGDFNRK